MSYQPTRRDVIASWIIDRIVLPLASGPTRVLFRRALLDAARREYGISLHRKGYTPKDIDVLCLHPSDDMRSMCDRMKNHLGGHSWQWEAPF